MNTNERTIDNNQPIEVTLGSETLLMTPEEYDHIMSLGIHFTDDWKERLLENKQYNLLINALFTMSKIDDAWEVIENHVGEIDFDYIFNTKPDSPCPFFQIKRDAQNVYKYMYNNKIIDDMSYAYFQILGGQLSDLDFWKEYTNGMSVSEKLQRIHDSYNFNNPFQIGLIVPTKETMEFIMDGLQEGELLDEYIIGQSPAVFFDVDTLLGLLYTNHLTPENYPNYFDILMQMYIADNNENVKELLNKTWSAAYDLCGGNIIHIKTDTIAKLDSFVESELMSKLIEENKIDVINSIIINSLAFMNYPYRYRELLKANGYEVSEIDAGLYLFESNYPYILSYYLLDFVCTDNFIIKYPFPAIMNCIYDKRNNMVYIDGVIKPYDEQDLSEFDFALYDNTDDDNKIKDKCSSDEEYEELRLAVKDFNSRIQNYLNLGNL